MNHSNAHERSPENSLLDVALKATKQRIKRIWVYAALGAWLAGTVGFLLLFVVGDHWIPGGVPRSAGWAARMIYGLGSLAWLVLAVGVPLVKRIHDLYASRLIEHSYPEFHNTVTDAVQLGGHSELPGSMRVAIVERAAGELAEVDYLRSVPTRRLRQVAILNGCLLAGLLIYALFAPKPLLPSLLRAFGSKVSAPTWTRIMDVSPADGTSVLRGDPVRFSAWLAGRTPASACVRFSLDDGKTWVEGQQLNLRPPADGKAGAWQGVKAGQDVQQSMLWQVVAGDAASVPRRLEVREIPVITTVQLHLEPPGYTRLPPSTQPGGDIDALVGTRASITALANVPVRDAILVIGMPPDDRRRILPPPPSTRPSEIAADLLVEKDDSYEVHFRDAWGQASRNPIRYTIRARPDVPPVIRVREPGPVTEVDHAGALPVSGWVEDDFGITRAAVALRLNGIGQARELPLSVVAEPGERSGEISGQIDLEAVGARPGDFVEWWVCVWDNRENSQGQTDAQKTESEVRRIVVTRAPVMASGERKHLTSDVPSVSTAPADRMEDRVNESTTTAPSVEQTRVADASQAQSRPASERSASADAERDKEPAPPSPDPQAVAETLADGHDARESTVDKDQKMPEPGEEALESAAGEQPVVASAQPEGDEPAEAELAQKQLEEFLKDHQQELETIAKHLTESGTPADGAQGAQQNGAAAGQQANAQSRGKAASGNQGGSKGGNTGPGQASNQPASGGNEGEQQAEAASSENASQQAAQTGAGSNANQGQSGKSGRSRANASASGSGQNQGGSEGQQESSDQPGSGEATSSAGESGSSSEGRSAQSAGRAQQAAGDSGEGRKDGNAGGHSGGEDASPAPGKAQGSGGADGTRSENAPAQAGGEGSKSGAQADPAAQQGAAAAGQPGESSRQGSDPAGQGTASERSGQPSGSKGDQSPGAQREGRPGQGQQPGNDFAEPGEDRQPGREASAGPREKAESKGEKGGAKEEKAVAGAPQQRQAEDARPDQPVKQNAAADSPADPRSENAGSTVQQTTSEEPPTPGIRQAPDRAATEPRESPTENGDAKAPGVDGKSESDPQGEQSSEREEQDQEGEQRLEHRSTMPAQEPPEAQSRRQSERPAQGQQGERSAQSQQERRAGQGQTPRESQQRSASSTRQSAMRTGQGRTPGESQSRNSMPEPRSEQPQNQRPGQAPARAQPQTQGEDEVESESLDACGNQGECPGQEQGQSDGQSQGQEQEQGQGQGQGQEQSQGQGQGQGHGQDQGQGQSQGQASGQGQGDDRGQGQGRGLSPGPDTGQTRGQGGGQGRGQGQNQEAGQSQSGGRGQQQGEGEGDGQARGRGRSLSQGPGQDGGESRGQSRGQSQSSDQGTGQRQGERDGQAQGPEPDRSQSGGQSTALGEEGGQGQGQGGGRWTRQSQQSTQGFQGGSTGDGGSGRPAPAQPLTIPEKAAEPDRPLELAPPPADPAAPVSSSGRLDRLMDLFERELRAGTVDPSLLAELKWTLPEAQQFVEAYRRAKVAGQRQVERTAVPQQVRTEEGRRGDNQVLRGGAVVDPAARTLHTTHERAPDRTRELMEVGRQRITPRYRSVLEAYYRSVGSRPGP